MAQCLLLSGELGFPFRRAVEVTVTIDRKLNFAGERAERDFKGEYVLDPHFYPDQIFRRLDFEPSCKIGERRVPPATAAHKSQPALHQCRRPLQKRARYNHQQVELLLSRRPYYRY